MPTIPVGVAGPSYEAASKAVVFQQAVNLFPEVSEAKGRAEIAAMIRAPGLATFGTAGDTGYRGGTVVNGSPYVVFGNALYSVASDGTHTSEGTITGTDRCQFADNGDYLVIQADSKAWYYRISTDTFAEITDSDLGTPIGVAFLDGYWIFPQEDSQQNVFNETVNDPTSLVSTDVFSKESDGSNMVRAFVNHRDLFLLGQDNTEVWRNVGDIDVPFARQDGAEIERGCLAKQSCAEMDNTFFFLGDDRVVYRMNGYTPQRVSTHGVETWLASLSLAEAEAAYGFTYTYRGHYFYVLQAGSETWAYDASASAQMGQSLWHERRSGSQAEDPWRIAGVIDAYGKQLAGDADTANLWELDHDGFQEDGTNMRWIRTCPPVFFEDKSVSHSRLELTVNAGIGTVTDDPQVWMRHSDDGGRTWSYRKQRGIGEAGKYANRVIWRRLGQAVQRIYEFSGTDNYDIALIDAQLTVEVNG